MRPGGVASGERARGALDCGESTRVETEGLGGWVCTEDDGRKGFWFVEEEAGCVVEVGGGERTLVVKEGVLGKVHEGVGALWGRACERGTWMRAEERRRPLWMVRASESGRAEVGT